MQNESNNSLTYRIVFVIITALIVNIITQAWILMSGNFSFVANNLKDLILDTIVYNASHASIYSYLNAFMGLIIGAYLGFVQTISLRSLSLINNFEKKVNVKPGNIGSKSKSESSHTKRNNMDAYKFIRRSKRNMIISACALILLSLSFVAFILITLIIPSTMKSSFDNSILKIQAYCKSETIDSYESDWASMENYDDYLRLASKIETEILEFERMKQTLSN